MNQIVVTTHPAAQRAARVIASVLGIGHLPWAPGTVASLLGLATGAAILRHGGPLGLSEAVLALSVLGLMATEYTGAATTDPGWIVIDEVAGQWLALVAVPASAGLWAARWWLLIAFVAFRLLDIAKPGPIGVIDRRHNAGAVMGDDLVAGAMVASVMWIVTTHWPHLLMG